MARWVLVEEAMSLKRACVVAVVLFSAGCGKKSPLVAIPAEASPPIASASVEPVSSAPPPATGTATTVTSAEPRKKNPNAKGCIVIPEGFDDGPEIELVGTLSIDTTFTHASNGVVTRPWILKLEKPRCTDAPVGWEDGSDEEKSSIRELHVSPEARRLDLRPLKNAKVKVKGRYFVAHTAWHARPLVMFLSSAERIGPEPERTPPEPLKDGKHYGHIDKLDLAQKTMSFDPAQLYRGKAAVAEMKRRKTLGGMLAEQNAKVDPDETFWVDEEFDPRTIPLASDVVAEANPVPTNNRDGGVQPNAPLPLATLADMDAGKPFYIDRGYEITIKDGKVVRIEETDRARY